MSEVDPSALRDIVRTTFDKPSGSPDDQAEIEGYSWKDLMEDLLAERDITVDGGQKRIHFCYPIEIDPTWEPFPGKEGVLLRSTLPYGNRAIPIIITEDGIEGLEENFRTHPHLALRFRRIEAGEGKFVGIRNRRAFQGDPEGRYLHYLPAVEPGMPQVSQDTTLRIVPLPPDLDAATAFETALEHSIDDALKDTYSSETQESQQKSWPRRFSSWVLASKPRVNRSELLAEGNVEPRILNPRPREGLRARTLRTIRSRINSGDKDTPPEIQ